MSGHAKRRRFLRAAANGGIALLTSSGLTNEKAVAEVHGGRDSSALPAKGPLRVHPKNPRYFTDGSGKAVYLTGSHNWYNLQDAGRIGEPVTKRLDYDGYLELLIQSHHNFMRMWAWEGAGFWWQGRVNKDLLNRRGNGCAKA